MLSGIYKIRNIINGHVYIGSAVNFKRRFKDHKNKLNRNTSHCPHLQAAWNKYGKDSFVFEIIEYVNPEILLEREQFYIDSLIDNMKYNSMRIAQSHTGMKRSAETIEKMKISAQNRKRPSLTEEHRKNISIALKGVKRSEETRTKMSLANKGKILTAEHKEKIKKAKTGVKMKKWSNEARERFGKMLCGRKLSEETKRKMSDARKRKKQNEQCAAY